MREYSSCLFNSQYSIINFQSQCVPHCTLHLTPSFLSFNQQSSIANQQSYASPIMMLESYNFMYVSCPTKMRSVRRHHRKRIIHRRYKRVHRGSWHVKNLGYLSKNNTVCSCWMCGNPRKYFGDVTRQEKLAKAECCHEGNTDA